MEWIGRKGKSDNPTGSTKGHLDQWLPNTSSPQCFCWFLVKWGKKKKKDNIKSFPLKLSLFNLRYSLLFLDFVPTSPFLFVVKWVVIFFRWSYVMKRSWLFMDLWTLCIFFVYVTGPWNHKIQVQAFMWNINSCHNIAPVLGCSDLRSSSFYCWTPSLLESVPIC